MRDLSTISDFDELLTAAGVAAGQGCRASFETLAAESTNWKQLKWNAGRMLNEAFRNQHPSLARYLVERGILTHPTTAAEVLYVAILMQYHDYVEMVLGAGVDLSRRSGTSGGQLPLFVAAAQKSPGSEVFIQQLVRAGAPLDAANHLKQTALHRAAFMGVTANAVMLLQLGANHTLLDHKNQTALQVAIRQNHAETVAAMDAYIHSHQALNVIKDVTSQPPGHLRPLWTKP